MRIQERSELHSASGPLSLGRLSGGA